MTTSQRIEYDILVLGGGIAGMQAALDLADQGFQVAIVDRDATIGGKMIRLDKVFPTLDCASCITTPKMASVAHHKNITIYTLCELKALNREGDVLRADVLQNPRYVDPKACIGCRQCEFACPVMVPDHEQGGLTARKAIYVPFANAIPQIALMDIENCILCGKCQKVCPSEAVDYFQKPEELNLNVGAVILTTGYQLLEDFPEKAYGPAGHQPNVVDALKVERILAPTGPYMRMLRPGDGKEPESVAFIQCAGSRDLTLGVGYCSRVCCMYAIKNALLIQHDLPSAEITIYYIDIRAFGKNYEQFFQRAKAKGIRFVKAKPTITGQGQNQSVILRYEDQEGTDGIITREHDLVVLSLAVIPAWNPGGLVDVSVAEDGFMTSISPRMAPAVTNVEGVFLAGMGAGPKDIVDTIVEAGAAATEAANYLTSLDQGKQAVA